MFAQKFFKLFPPPKFLDIPYAGLDISDDAVRCIEYSKGSHDLTIHRFGMKTLAPGVIEGGEIKNNEALITALAELSHELNVHVVKASLPEEKMYLFKTQVPSLSKKEIRQNIEFKLEENVPLTAEEAVFFFDLIPKSAGVVMKGEDGGNPIGVSVAPLSLVLPYLEAIKAAGITVLTFEVQAKGIARALVPKNSSGTDIIIYIMNKKTGIYVVVGGVVCFTSTISWGKGGNIEELKKNLKQVNDYWKEHGLGTTVSRIVFAGQGALADGLISECSSSFGPASDMIRFEIAKVWQNAFSHDHYIPPISHDESLDYAVAAGLALPEDE